jgi:putative transposase
VRTLCDEPRHEQFGHRRVRVLLRRRFDVRVSRETVRRIMRDEGLSRPRIWHRPSRPHHVEKARPTRPNEFWQVDMTSFQLSDLTPLFLVVVIDCFTREIAGYTLDRRCRAREWIAAVRTAIEQRGITEETARALTLRSDNGSQPCSKDFVEYLGSVRVRGQYTGYNAPDDNAFVERVIRTIKEEEVWPNLWDTVSEAREAIENYVAYYNNDRIHSALDYATPKEVADASAALKAA